MNNLLKIKVMTIKNPQWRKVFLLWLTDDKGLDCYLKLGQLLPILLFILKTKVQDTPSKSHQLKDLQ